MNPWAKAAVQGAACGLVFGAVVLIGGRLWQPQVPAVAEEVRARRFEVVDDAGKLRALLAVRPDGGPGLVLYDAAETNRAILFERENGEAYLGLCDAAGTTRASLSVTKDSQPGLDLYDAAGKVRARLTLAGGSPVLALADAAGNERATLGSTILEVVKTGEERRRAESSLVLFDKDGKVMWKVP